MMYRLSKDVLNKDYWPGFIVAIKAGNWEQAATFIETSDYCESLGDEKCHRNANQVRGCIDN